MAVTASGLFFPTWRDALNGTIVVNLDLETHKVAMFTDTVTPNFSTDTAYGVAPYNANEVTDGLSSYVAGGKVLTTTTVTEDPTGSLKFDGADVEWTSSSISNAECALIYADALAGNNALCLVDFGSAYSTTNGTFTIQWAAAGIFAWDLTPP